MTARPSTRPPDKLQPPSTHAPRASLLEVLSPEVVVGVRVVVLDKHSGVVRFTGETKFAEGQWVGVELDQPEGKNDGTIKGVSYFSCAPAKGLFARPHAVRLEGTREPTTEETPAPTASAALATLAAPEAHAASPAPAGAPARAAESSGSRQQHPRPSVLETIPSEVVPGVRVVVLDKHHGVVRFTGGTKFALGQWVGAELDKPSGKNNGTVEGVSYFHCEPLHGIFARPSAVKLESALTTSAATPPVAAAPSVAAVAPVAAAVPAGAEPAAAAPAASAPTAAAPAGAAPAGASPTAAAPTGAMSTVAAPTPSTPTSTAPAGAAVAAAPTAAAPTAAAPTAAAPTAAAPTAAAPAAAAPAAAVPTAVVPAKAALAMAAPAGAAPATAAPAGAAAAAAAPAGAAPTGAAPMASVAPAAPTAGEVSPAKAKARAKTPPTAVGRALGGTAETAARAAPEPTEEPVKVPLRGAPGGAAAESAHATKAVPVAVQPQAVPEQQKKDQAVTYDTGVQCAKVLSQLADELQKLQAHIGSVTSTLSNTEQHLLQLQRQVPTAGPPRNEAPLGADSERFLERLEERIQRSIVERLEATVVLPQQELLKMHKS